MSARRTEAADRRLVARLRAGRGLSELYAAYAVPIYRYCWARSGGQPGPSEQAPAGPGLPVHGLSQAEAPTVALRETFMIAIELAGRLPDPALLRPWLYALARAVCAPSGGPHIPPESVSGALRPVAAALAELNAGDREMLELTLRHHLSTEELAAVLGVPAEVAQVRAETAAARLRTALGRSCSGFSTAPTVAVVQPHTGHLAWSMPAEAGDDAGDLGTLLEVLPLPRPPRALRDVIVAACGDPALADERRRLAGQVAMRPNGFPGPVAGAPLFVPRQSARPALDDASGQVIDSVRAVVAAAAEDHRRRGRWTVPLVAGVAAALALILVYGTGMVRGATGAPTVADPPRVPREKPVPPRAKPAPEGSATPMPGPERTPPATTKPAPEPETKPGDVRSEPRTSPEPSKSPLLPLPDPTPTPTPAPSKPKLPELDLISLVDGLLPG